MPDYSRVLSGIHRGISDVTSALRIREAIISSCRDSRVLYLEELQRWRGRSTMVSFGRVGYRVTIYTWASRCCRRGLADARITRFPFSALRTGRSRANTRKGLAVVALTGTSPCCAAASYDGGGSIGVVVSGMLMASQM